MINNKREVSLSEEERRFLNLCFKSKSIFTLKKKVMSERVLNRFKAFKDFYG